MDEDQTLWTSTNYSDEADVRVGPFVGLQVYLLGAAILVGFILTYLFIRKLGWPLLSSCLIGFLPTAIFVVLLLKLVVGKADMFWLDWFESQVIRITGGTLFKFDQPEESEE